MKNSLLLLTMVVLIGAGCAGSTTLETTVQTETENQAQDSSTNVTDETATEATKKEETSSTTPATKTTSETNLSAKQKKQTIIESGDATFVVETDTKANADIKSETGSSDEDNVPIIDVVLGGATQKIDMEAMNFAFSPKTMSAKPGEKIQITFAKNNGFHTFVIDELNLKFAIKQGESLSFTAPTTPGDYIYYCDVGSHRANGQWGTLTVK